MDYEGIVPNEVSQTKKTNIVQYHLYLESKKAELIKIEQNAD